MRAVLALLWAAAVAGLTLTPQATVLREADLPQISACLVCGSRGTADAFLNLLLFLPFGILLRDRGWKLRHVAGLALALSTSIETSQHFIPGRYSNLADMLWNTTGAWVGAALWSLRARWLPGAGRDAARLRAFAVALPALATLAFGWLMKPVLPPEPYWGQWTPDLGFMEPYRGQVLEARLDSMGVPPGRFPPGAHPRRLLSGDWRLDARIVKGPPPTRLAPILNIYDGKRREVTMLGAVGQELVFRERTLATRVRLDDPALRVPGMLAGTPTGDTVAVGVMRRGGSRCLSVGGSERCPELTPGRAWALLLPDSWSKGVRRSLDAVWMLLLLLPVGFWSERKRDAVTSGVAAGLLIGLAVAATRIGLPPWMEVGGAVLGVLVGYALRSAVRALIADFPWRRS